ncbi:MAG: hypothetical protein FRX48_08127 [Lasallia pustulata]|uniref:Uncharacterized protein n=1 Tax=Lasallia pustulata TaxID=136370 RepID=A0A5M8PGG6_9LECA|nr:MAG: hypothetical protein FRX48_08127 [Lasallia pustulata]
MPVPPINRLELLHKVYSADLSADSFRYTIGRIRIFNNIKAYENKVLSRLDVVEDSGTANGIPEGIGTDIGTIDFVEEFKPSEVREEQKRLPSNQLIHQAGAISNLHSITLAAIDFKSMFNGQ